MKDTMFRRLAGSISTVVVSLLLVSCSSDDNTMASNTGGGTETTNGTIVAGVVADSVATPRSNAQVRIRPLTFLADTGAFETPTGYDTLSAGNGTFSMCVRDSGSFLLSVITPDSLVSADTISVQPSRDSLRLDTIFCVPGATLYGVIDYPAHTDSTTYWLRVYGLDGAHRITGVTAYSISSLPPGKWDIHCTVLTKNRAFSVRSTTPRLHSGKSTLDSLHAANITRDLSLYWSMDSLKGDTIIDQSGNGYHATQNFMSRGPGKLHQSAIFDSSNALISTVSAFNPPLQGSVAFWFKVHTAPSNTQYRLFSSQSSCFEISLGENAITNELCACNTEHIYDSTDIALNKWHHIVCTWNTTTGINRIYLNGVHRSEGFYADDIIDSVRLSLGNSLIANHSDSSFKGAIDEVRLYSREIEPAEIKALAQGLY